MYYDSLLVEGIVKSQTGQDFWCEFQHSAIIEKDYETGDIYGGEEKIDNIRCEAMDNSKVTFNFKGVDGWRTLFDHKDIERLIINGRAKLARIRNL